MRLIDADALKEKAINVCYEDDYESEGFGVVYVRHIDEAPTIDAKPVVHGKWVGTADGYADGELVYDMWECSECGYDADGADEKPSWSFCPNCGAKMDGEKKNDENS